MSTTDAVDRLIAIADEAERKAHETNEELGVARWALDKIIDETANKGDLCPGDFMFLDAAFGLLKRCLHAAFFANEKHAELEDMIANEVLPEPASPAGEHSVFQSAQSSAHAKVAAAIQSGDLVRPGLCSECNAECKPVAHHDSYDKPLNVRWLCRSCHGKHHAEHGPAECTA
ncbi:MAG: hypothetical protein GTN69_10510 [Armatimonadetes bacterium]|nr:hypothetical protein [Armatimonadota bacterium]